MIDDVRLLLLVLTVVKTELAEMLGEDWPRFASELAPILDELERDEPQAKRKLLDLFSSRPEAYRTLIDTFDKLGAELVNLPKSPPNPATSAKSFIRVPIYFVTNRSRSGALVPPYYSGGRGPIRFGRAEVSIPYTHKIGQVERPSWWKFQFVEDPTRHLVLLEVAEFAPEPFRAELESVIETAPENDALIFVHGYNVSFEDAARRTAQIAADLRFAGPTILFSWPSRAHLYSYAEDETNARWATGDFETFLRMMLGNVRCKWLHVMSHSMGSRVTVDALERISLSPESDGAARLRHIIFAAPDIDAATFRTAATRFHARGERCTLYASSNDEALIFSKKLHGYPRAGDTGEEVLVIAGVDTIDASAMDTSFMGHSYYGSKRSVLSDIHDLVRYGHGPDGRFGLIQRPHRFGIYWLFQG